MLMLMLMLLMLMLGPINSVLLMQRPCMARKSFSAPEGAIYKRTMGLLIYAKAFIVEVRFPYLNRSMSRSLSKSPPCSP
jgi:hypothetical protein